MNRDNGQNVFWHTSTTNTTTFIFKLLLVLVSDPPFPPFLCAVQIEDVLEQRLVDDAPSDEEDDEELQPDDNDLLHLHDGEAACGVCCLCWPRCMCVRAIVCFAFFIGLTIPR